MDTAKPSSSSGRMIDEAAYLPALGEGVDPYTLEWFPKGRTGPHPRAIDKSKDREGLVALLGLFRERLVWRGALVWLEARDERLPPSARFLRCLRTVRARHRRTSRTRGRLR